MENPKVNIFNQFREWCKEISRWGKVDDFFRVIEADGKPNGPNTQVYHLFTHIYHYSIVVKEDGEHTYLGCVVSTRKPRAGEACTRGNDLVDGPFCRETWEKIKNDILAYELVKIVKKSKRILTKEK